MEMEGIMIYKFLKVVLGAVFGKGIVDKEFAEMVLYYAAKSKTKFKKVLNFR